MKHRPETVVYLARECRGFVDVGGVKDVAAGLAAAAAQAGIETHLFIPYHRCADRAAGPPESREAAVRLDVPMDFPTARRTESAAVYTLSHPAGFLLHLVDGPRIRSFVDQDPSVARTSVFTYTGAEARALGQPKLAGLGHVDYFALNVLFQKAVIRSLGPLGIRPDLIHCHDGHTALVPAMIQVAALLNEPSAPTPIDPALAAVPTVVTIHNAGRGYRQEIEDVEFASTLTGLPPTTVMSCCLHDRFEPFVAAAFFGATVTTVSENHARELQETGVDCLADGLGHHLKAMGITLRGITNGIDLSESAPSGSFAELLTAKQQARERLLEAWRTDAISDRYPEIHGHGYLAASTEGTAETETLVAYVGRLGWQKGIDLLLEAVEAMLSAGASLKLVVLGAGDPATERALESATERFPGRVVFAAGYSEGLGELIYDAADLFVLPSRYEPCGLADLIAQAHGALPVVHAVGGLVKVIDGQTGFSYRGGPPQLRAALERGLTLHGTAATWRRMQRAAVRSVHENFSWKQIFERRYLPLYREARERTQPVSPPVPRRRQTAPAPASAPDKGSWRDGRRPASPAGAGGSPS